MIKIYGIYAILFCLGAANSWTPLFNIAEKVKIGNTFYCDLPITLSGATPPQFQGMPTPTFVDLNNDGLRDLVTGIFDDGAILYSLNTGTKETPAFSAYDFFKTGGKTSFVQPI